MGRDVTDLAHSLVSSIGPSLVLRCSIYKRCIPKQYILKLRFLKGTVLSGKLVKKCQLGTYRAQHCKYKQAQQERHLCFKNTYSQSRFITKGKTGATVIILELIYFNQKNCSLQRQSKLSAAQHKTKRSIYFFFTSHKTSMQYAWSSRNKALITGVDKHHEPRYTVYAVFQRKREAKREWGQLSSRK